MHQPRFDALSCFDTLVLLGPRGVLVYAGPMSGTANHFANLGVHCEQQQNPADVWLDALATGDLPAFRAAAAASTAAGPDRPFPAPGADAGRW